MGIQAYDAFGKAQVQVSAIENNLRFPGQYYDTESGLHYNYHRYYDPKTGRYVTADPIGLKGGGNVYSFVLNNPIKYKDPKGLKILICSRTTGFGIGNHSYLWDTINNRSCGMQGMFGQGNTSGNETGPDTETNGDACVEVPNSEGSENDVWNCCSDPKQINRGPWIPGINDCHSRAGNCLSKANLIDPGAPGGRLGHCKSCWLK